MGLGGYEVIALIMRLVPYEKKTGIAHVFLAMWGCNEK